MKKNILLVEDAELSADIMKKELEYLGYDCVVAQDGKEAVQKAGDALPDLILMDICMPEMDGLEATAEIRKNPRTKAIPIIAVTARAMPGDKEKCIQVGCNAYLSKPLSHRELGPCIEKVLNGKE
jgi:two-component system cell cycle response regulator DivK